MLALTALLLDRVGIRKEGYMENLPYLYGQLLKTSDELHVLYCKAVRNGDVPPQLVGGSLFQAAAADTESAQPAHHAVLYLGKKLSL